VTADCSRWPHLWGGRGVWLCLTIARSSHLDPRPPNFGLGKPSFFFSWQGFRVPFHSVTRTTTETSSRKLYRHTQTQTTNITLISIIDCIGTSHSSPTMPPSFQVSDHSLENDCCVLLRRTEADTTAPQSSCSLEKLNRREQKQEASYIVPMDEDDVPTMMRPRRMMPSSYESFPAKRNRTHPVEAATVRNRHVHFGGIHSMKRIESTRDMTDEDISDRWYSKAELLAFKQAARDLCKGEQRQLQLLGRGGTPLSAVVDEETSSTRGMDVYFPSRQRHQAKYIWHVLQAFQHLQHQQQQQQQQQHEQCGINSSSSGTDPDYYVALLCEKWSAKVSLQAAQRAIHDFYDAYFPSWRTLAATTASSCSSSSSSSISISSTRPSTNHNKRAAPY